MALKLVVLRRCHISFLASLGIFTIPLSAAFADDVPKITRVTPATTLPGLSREVRIEGTNLKSIKSLMVNFPEAPSIVALKACKDEQTALCGNLNIPPGTPPKEYSITVSTTADGKNGSETGLTLTVLPPVGSEVGYVPCPTSIGVTPVVNSAIIQPDNGLNE